jgi:hypothetical protein
MHAISSLPKRDSSSHALKPPVLKSSRVGSNDLLSGLNHFRNRGPHLGDEPAVSKEDMERVRKESIEILKRKRALAKGS